MHYQPTWAIGTPGYPVVYDLIPATSADEAIESFYAKRPYWRDLAGKVTAFIAPPAEPVDQAEREATLNEWIAWLRDPLSHGMNRTQGYLRRRDDDGQICHCAGGVLCAILIGADSTHYRWGSPEEGDIPGVFQFVTLGHDDGTSGGGPHDTELTESEWDDAGVPPSVRTRLGLSYSFLEHIYLMNDTGFSWDAIAEWIAANAPIDRAYVERHGRFVVDQDWSAMPGIGRPVFIDPPTLAFEREVLRGLRSMAGG